MKIQQQTTISFTKEEIETLIKNHLKEQGYEAEQITFRIKKEQRDLGLQASLEGHNYSYEVFDGVTVKAK